MNPREPLRIYGIACALTRRPVSVTPDFATAECLWTELNLFCRLGVRRERKATAARSCRVIHRDLDPHTGSTCPQRGLFSSHVVCVKETAPRRVGPVQSVEIPTPPTRWVGPKLLSAVVHVKVSTPRRGTLRIGSSWWD